MFFHQRVDEHALKQREADRKKEYAQELQNQIAQKKLHQKQQLPPRAHSHRQQLRDAPAEPMPPMQE